MQKIATQDVEMFFANENDYVTGYRLAKKTNEALDFAGVKNIPAQMVYNYMSKRLIATVVIDDQRVVEKKVAIEWLTKYINKKLG